jgi:hypothetical protein
LLLQIQLARRWDVCLIAVNIVQLGQTLSRVGRMPKSAVGGLLALSLLFATAFSVSHALHQSLHQDGPGSGHFCLVCSFAKGQVSTAVVAVVSAVLTFCCLWWVRLASTNSLPRFDYRFSPSRAPPQP